MAMMARSAARPEQASPPVARAPPGVQAKLRIGPVDDPLEREADRVAYDAMTSSSGNLAGAPVVHKVPRTAGRPLDSATRAYFEPRFRARLRHVRIHADAADATAAARWNARAFTLNHHIYFGDSYEPSSPAGQALLAHELTHVIQADAAVSNPAQPANSAEALEREARQVAAAFRSGGVVPPIRGLARGLAAPLRQPDEPTFGEVGGLRTPVGGHSVELIELNGKVYEIDGQGNSQLATSRYNFVIKDKRIRASRYGHAEAIAGEGNKRVTYAGQVEFDNAGKLVGWNAESGTYKPAESFARKAAGSLLGDPNGEKFRKFSPGLGKKQVQLPVYQPGAGTGKPGAPGGSLVVGAAMYAIAKYDDPALAFKDALERGFTSSEDPREQGWRESIAGAQDDHSKNLTALNSQWAELSAAFGENDAYIGLASSRLVAALAYFDGQLLAVEKLHYGNLDRFVAEMAVVSATLRQRIEMLPEPGQMEAVGNSIKALDDVTSSGDALMSLLVGMKNP